MRMGPDTPSMNQLQATTGGHQASRGSNRFPGWWG
ncbi:MAG TPA: hypothetical protein DEF41_07225 [Desulfovibrio sp.]|uniref:Uncharacterized protein n=1 Tax=Nitratidesulfovibrio vulgaris (strain ATCC 29579 / DSM 644 / CCUG 34227 / NCIMB 8303 / VKM B-1760 / Hildenborough) TaxID=882 RepID=Q728Y3_NITV2|nr:hypothetical protein DVU_2469 [Nitratidesulfovibrio vulgaris str. Hildenborough]HBW15916.1 hypothetical protein [Desulfovibrio sp.]